MMVSRYIVGLVESLHTHGTPVRKPEEAFDLESGEGGGF